MYVRALILLLLQFIKGGYVVFAFFPFQRDAVPVQITETEPGLYGIPLTQER